MLKIKYYSKNDLSYAYFLEKCENIIALYMGGKNAQNINDFIELYNIKKYMDNEIYLAKWDKEEISTYTDFINFYFKDIAIFFSSISNENIKDLYSQVDLLYKDDFWEMFDSFEIYKKISHETFEILISPDKYTFIFLYNKNIVRFYDKVIRRHLIDNTKSAELLLNIYEVKLRHGERPLYLPSELSSQDKEDIINAYIDSNNANPNYLNLIVNIKSNKDALAISPKTILKAKRKLDCIHSQPLINNYALEITASFNETQGKEFKTIIEDHKISAEYNIEWIINNNDYATLLNNFIYLFNYVDSDMRCLLVNKTNHMGVFERFGRMDSKNSYKKGIGFDLVNSMALSQITAYYDFLLKIEIRLEDVIEWFFSEYLSSEFNADGFDVCMPSSNSTFSEKCTNIFPAMESVLKQFTLFVEEGEIDFELLSIRPIALKYSNIPSLLNKKYAYGLGEEYHRATYCFFSDQSPLSYCEKNATTYNSFFELMYNEKLKLTDYSIHFTDIDWLLKHNYLSIDNKGYLVFSNATLINILQDLFFNEVICYWRYPDESKEIMDELANNKIIEFENTLFSRPEQDYINYLLNTSKINNGPAFRNKYIHTQPFNPRDVNKNKKNYMIFLSIFIIAVIKINDEFCLMDNIVG